MTIRQRTNTTIAALLLPALLSPALFLAALLPIVSFCSCGYEGETLVADVSTQARSDGALEQTIAKGFSDPDASSFIAGVMLYARWTVSREEVRTVELFLDLDGDALPDEVRTDPVLLTGDDVRATVRYRLISGRPKSEHIPSGVEVIVRSWHTEQLRRRSRGDFTLDLSDDAGIYTNISGSWETNP